MKKAIKSDYRVTIDVEDHTPIFGGFREDKTEQQQHEECQEIVHQIRRHVDGGLNPRIRYDTEYICSFCELDWELLDDTNDPDHGLPVCCLKAQEEFKAKGK